MFSPSRTSPIRYSRVLTLALGAIAAFSHIAAAQTIGVEWELSGDDVFVTGATTTGSYVDPALIARTSDGKATKELLCTTEDVPVPGTTHRQPLVAVTYDLGEDAARVLEIVTGPVAYNDSTAWPRIEQRVGAFIDAIRPTCDSIEETCETTADAVLNKLGGDWHVCPGTQFDGQVGKIAFVAKHRLKFLSAVNTQVNVAIDLPRIAMADRTLYTKAFAKKGIWVGGMGPSDTLLVSVIHDYLAGVFGERPYSTKLTENERGFLVWYFTALNVERVAKARGFEHNHFQLKNLFDLYLKAPLNELLAKLGSSRMVSVLEQIRGMNKKLGGTWLCATVDEPCTATAWSTLMTDWYTTIKGGDDPLELRKSQVTKAIAPYDDNGQIKLVVESRLSENPLNDALGLAILGGKVSFRNRKAAVDILDAFFK